MDWNVDEEKVKEIIRTELRPTSILCIGYPIKKRPAKLRRQLKRTHSCSRERKLVISKCFCEPR